MPLTTPTPIAWIPCFNGNYEAGQMGLHPKYLADSLPWIDEQVTEAKSVFDAHGLPCRVLLRWPGGKPQGDESEGKAARIDQAKTLPAAGSIALAPYALTETSRKAGASEVIVYLGSQLANGKSPRTSPSMWEEMAEIGRALRPWIGHTDRIVLDHSWAYNGHPLMFARELIAGGGSIPVLEAIQGTYDVPQIADCYYFIRSASTLAVEPDDSEQTLILRPPKRASEVALTDEKISGWIESGYTPCVMHTLDGGLDRVCRLYREVNPVVTA